MFIEVVEVAVIVAFVGESCKSCSVKIDGQRVIGRAESVDSHVELSATEQERVEQVALADIGFGRVVPIERFPPRYISNFAEYKDAFSLAFGSRFHDPQSFAIVLGAFELLVKNDVFAGKEEGGGQEIVLIGLLFVVLLIESSFVFFQIFIEHIFSAQFEPSSKMVNFHMR